ncbi:MAG: acetylglutamate kinase [Bacteroidales bacterium]|mgnify:CR=1 FL=1|nr:acetylglutamate kinase [Bacteroidales bacterium]ODT55924.1 MAG: acetylglutamate kinase [Paludibacter sp. SCN 50-10]OJX87737.1 MAG: acetylglutamate kinase [Paludibacter sp. 47-17]
MKQELTIVKVGGKIVEEPASLQQLLAGFLKIKGHKLLVHGGGRSATAIAARLGIESRMVDGRRITDEAMLEVVTMVYGGLVNKQIVAALQALGLNAMGLTGADLNYMVSEKRPVGAVDYGFVGDVKLVNAGILADLVARGVVPVLAPLTHDGKGTLLNTNADTIAAEAAKALAAHFSVTLQYCFEKKGVLRNENDDESVIGNLTPRLFDDYVAKGIIRGGMIPKLENAFDALQDGVTKVVITRADLVGSTEGTTIELV